MGNFLVVEVTPKGVTNLGWKFYIVWAVLNLANAIIVWIFYPETGGQPLEAIDTLFVTAEGVQDEHGRRMSTLHVVEGAGKRTGLARMQWRIVQKAHEQVKWYKMNRIRSSDGGEHLGGDTKDAEVRKKDFSSEEKIESVSTATEQK